jgi:general secretion pathway protein F
MLGAGQDLDRALRYVVENAANDRIRTVLGEVRDRVRRGSSLARSLAAAPNSFSRLYIGMVRAGEAGATLASTLDRLADLMEHEHSLRANLRSAMIYPAVLVVAALGTIMLLLDYVLPQFTPIFEQAGAQLPASTRALMALGTAVQMAGP